MDKKGALLGGIMLLTALGGLHYANRHIKHPTVKPQNNCDESLWSHVYAGDPKRFHNPKDRLKIIQDCVTITGTIINAKAEKDGDYHVRVDIDRPYKSLLNDKNYSGQHGYLVIEPICEVPVFQRDVLQEAVCAGFKQNIFTTDMIGKHIEITGAYIIDQEHGWAEIHPISSIKIIP